VHLLQRWYKLLQLYPPLLQHGEAVPPFSFLLKKKNMYGVYLSVKVPHWSCVDAYLKIEVLLSHSPIPIHYIVGRSKESLIILPGFVLIVGSILLVFA
jgi:hypothetical protein